MTENDDGVGRSLMKESQQEKSKCRDDPKQQTVVTTKNQSDLAQLRNPPQLYFRSKGHRTVLDKYNGGGVLTTSNAGKLLPVDCCLSGLPESGSVFFFLFLRQLSQGQCCMNDNGRLGE